MTQLTNLPTTDSGTVRKSDAMEWLTSLDTPTDDELQASVVSKDSDASGSSYARGDSMVRVTGDPAFVEKFAGFLTPFLAFENDDTRLEISLKQAEDRDTSERTENHALYVSVAERG